MKKAMCELELKKQTLIAWTKILLKEGKITVAKCNKMISIIERMTS